MIELVWDAGQTATVRLPNGTELTVGGRAGLPPADLAAVGLAASVMAAFVDEARRTGCNVLGFLANTEVRTLSGPRPTVYLHAYVVTDTALDRTTFARLGATALDHSVVARLLGEALDVQWDLQVLQSADPGATRWHRP